MQAASSPMMMWRIENEKKTRKNILINGQFKSRQSGISNYVELCTKNII